MKKSKCDEIKLNSLLSDSAYSDVLFVKGVESNLNIIYRLFNRQRVSDFFIEGYVGSISDYDRLIDGINDLGLETPVSINVMIHEKS